MSTQRGWFTNSDGDSAAIPGETLVSSAECKAYIRDWIAALNSGRTGQTYSIAGRSLTLPSPGEMRAIINYWVQQLHAVRAIERRTGCDARGPQLPGALVANFRSGGVR